LKLRNKLIVLHASVMALLFLIIVGLLVNFFRQSIPLMEAGVLTATRSCMASMLRDVDIGIATRDRQMLRQTIGRCDFEDQKHDTRFIAITDGSGRVLAARGAVPSQLRADRAAKEPQVDAVAAGFRGQAPVWLEGKRLGTVWAELSTAWIHQWKSSYLLLSAIALTLVLISGIASVLFALHLIRPLREMIDHVHRVAGGDLDGQLTTGARDELGQLAADLNTMTVKVRESRDLVADASRHAGQAEVATSVLHNVGNVLNSINVSTEMLHHRLRHSKVESLAKMAGMIEAWEDGPSSFARSDKGRDLPRFVCALARRLSSEREAILGEVAALRENLEHVKAIVTTQQQYSKAAGMKEQTNLGEIIETAIQITLTGDQSRQITVQKELNGVPVVVLDRHRLLQVLINLLRNAKYALQASPNDEKQVTVRVVARGEERFAIEIRDNGVGIPEENKTKIFQHGFTTRPDGHGFGLHSSSIAVQEMGGRLSCVSSGADTGATFTVELPLHVGRCAPVGDKEQGQWTKTRGLA
jgi:signal transduction histidine kinase